MSERIMKIDITPEGAKTPEGIQRINAAVEARNQIDYQAMQALFRLVDEGLVSRFLLAKTLREHLGESKANATEWANEIMEEIEKLQIDRRKADHELVAAVAGRSA